MEDEIIKKQEIEQSAIEEPSSWNNLPQDIMELIIHRLDNMVDRLQVALTCTDWHSQTRLIRPHNGLPYGLPCLLRISKDGQKCHVIDPLYNMTYTIINKPCLSPDVEILSSKDGWLLLCEGRCSMFFFNPLTRERIYLPDLYDTQSLYFSLSASPTSSDCLVLAMITVRKDRCDLLFCRRGDKEWTYLGFKNDELSFEIAHASPIFFCGRFYCVGMNGRVGVFDPESNNWTVLPRPRQLDFEAHQHGIVVSCGEILFVFMHHKKNLAQVFKFDTSTNQLVRVDTLRDRSLFIGFRASISPETPLNCIKNNIYLQKFKGEDCMYYSYEDGKLHPKGGIERSQELPRASWIELKWSQPSPMEHGLHEQ